MKRGIRPDFIPESEKHLYPQSDGPYRDYVPAPKVAPQVEPEPAPEPAPEPEPAPAAQPVTYVAMSGCEDDPEFDDPKQPDPDPADAEPKRKRK